MSLTGASGGITRKGVFGPMTKDIYLPMLDKLHSEGIVFDEGTR